MVHVDSCVHEVNLRPSKHHGDTFIKISEPPLDDIVIPASPARCPSRSSSKNSSRSNSKTDGENCQLKGPERFFHDKSTYTGIHRNGGATTKDKDGFPCQLRPSMHLGSNFACMSGHPLDNITRPTSPAMCSSRNSSKNSTRNASKTDEKCQLKGPERFFYDRNTYTGVHRQGGPTTKERESFPLQLRPGMHLGSTFTCSSEHPLDNDRSMMRASSLGAINILSSPAKANVRASSCCSDRRGTQDSTCDIKGPERFFYDKSSYTGVHKCGGPGIRDDREAWVTSMRSGVH